MLGAAYIDCGRYSTVTLALNISNWLQMILSSWLYIGTLLHETKNGQLMVTQCLTCLSVCLPPLPPLPLRTICCIGMGFHVTFLFHLYAFSAGSENMMKS